MISTLAEAVQRYETLSEERKAQVLGRLSLDLTILSRDLTHEPQLDSSHVTKLKGINEIHHKALGQLLAYLHKRQERYSDKDIITILMKMANNYDILGSVQNSLLREIENQG